MRRALFLLSGLVLSVAAPLAKAATPVVRLPEGEVSGITADGVSSWKGVPYAAPPVGALRWRAPRAHSAWSGVRNGETYGHDCMQVPFPGDALPPTSTPSEDCLYANVWRPENAKGKLPVLVWVHGGGFTNGGASSLSSDGTRLARQGVVVVSFNYRLGRFGTFAHPALTRAQEDGPARGNYGFMDQIAALRWVRDRIGAFGGDPRRVTVMGESAGGISILAMLTSPAATGLFARAVIMSGGDGSGLGGAPRTFQDIERTGVLFAHAEGIQENDRDALAKLRALPAARVAGDINMISLFRPGERTFSSPFPDGKFILDGRSALASGRAAKVPVMIGATADDIGGPQGAMIAGSLRVAALLTPRAPVFVYRFSYPAGASGSSKAPHASDVVFFFDNLRFQYGERATPRDMQLAHVIGRQVVSFVQTGTPAGADLPAWPMYDPSSNSIMNFTAEGKAIAGPDPALAH